MADYWLATKPSPLLSGTEKLHFLASCAVRCGGHVPSPRQWTVSGSDGCHFKACPIKHPTYDPP